jgi:hypothetical protein
METKEAGSGGNTLRGSSCLHDAKFPFHLEFSSKLWETSAYWHITLTNTHLSFGIRNYCFTSEVGSLQFTKIVIWAGKHIILLNNKLCSAKKMISINLQTIAQ